LASRLALPAHGVAHSAMMIGTLIIFISIFVRSPALHINPGRFAKSGYALHAQSMKEQLQHYHTPPVFSKTSTMSNSGTYTKSLNILLSKVIGGPTGAFRQYIEDTLTTFLNKPQNSTSSEWPRIIHQTAKSEADLNPMYKASRHSWQHHHPDWEYKFWNDTDIVDFMESHYPTFMDTWNLFPMQIMRIDAVRYFWMHHYGGIYADMDYFALRNWGSFFSKEEAETQIIIPMLYDAKISPQGTPTFHKGSHRHGQAVCNALLMSKPQHPFWKIVHEFLHYRLHRWSFRLDAETSNSSLYQEAEALIDHYYGNPTLQPEAGAGPIFLTDLVKTLGGDRLKDFKAKLPSGSSFYPIDWTKGDDVSWRAEHRSEFAKPDLIEDALRKSFPSSLGATVWAHSWHHI